MAWTAPMTAVANSAFTAAQFNAHIRDNLLETAPAKATTLGGYFVATGLNAVVQRIGQRETIATEQNRSSTAFGNLATPGPSVTVQTGSLALVIWSCEMRNSVSGATCRVTVDVTGASSIPGDDIRSLTNASGSDHRHQSTHAVFYDDLSTGTNVFTMRYRVSSGTGTFQRRRLIVLPY